MSKTLERATSFNLPTVISTYKGPITVTNQPSRSYTSAQHDFFNRDKNISSSFGSGIVLGNDKTPDLITTLVSDTNNPDNPINTEIEYINFFKSNIIYYILVSRLLKHYIDIRDINNANELVKQVRKLKNKESFLTQTRDGTPWDVSKQHAYDKVNSIKKSLNGLNKVISKMIIDFFIDEVGNIIGLEKINYYETLQDAVRRFHKIRDMVSIKQLTKFTKYFFGLDLILTNKIYLIIFYDDIDNNDNNKIITYRTMSFKKLVNVKELKLEDSKPKQETGVKLMDVLDTLDDNDNDKKESKLDPKPDPKSASKVQPSQSIQPAQSIQPRPIISDLNRPIIAPVGETEKAMDLRKLKEQRDQYLPQIEGYRPQIVNIGSPLNGHFDKFLAAFKTTSFNDFREFMEAIALIYKKTHQSFEQYITRSKKKPNITLEELKKIYNDGRNMVNFIRDIVYKVHIFYNNDRSTEPYRNMNAIDKYIKPYEKRKFRIKPKEREQEQQQEQAAAEVIKEAAEVIKEQAQQDDDVQPLSDGESEEGFGSKKLKKHKKNKKSKKNKEVSGGVTGALLHSIVMEPKLGLQPSSKQQLQKLLNNKFKDGIKSGAKGGAVLNSEELKKQYFDIKKIN